MYISFITSQSDHRDLSSSQTVDMVLPNHTHSTSHANRCWTLDSPKERDRWHRAACAKPRHSSTAGRRSSLRNLVRWSLLKGNNVSIAHSSAKREHQECIHEYTSTILRQTKRHEKIEEEESIPNPSLQMHLPLNKTSHDTDHETRWETWQAHKPQARGLREAWRSAPYSGLLWW